MKTIILKINGWTFVCGNGAVIYTHQFLNGPVHSCPVSCASMKFKLKLIDFVALSLFFNAVDSMHNVRNGHDNIAHDNTTRSNEKKDTLFCLALYLIFRVSLTFLLTYCHVIFDCNWFLVLCMRWTEWNLSNIYTNEFVVESTWILIVEVLCIFLEFVSASVSLSASASVFHSSFQSHSFQWTLEKTK